ncbi:hypothetical protein [Nautilia sp.]
MKKLILTGLFTSLFASNFTPYAAYISYSKNTAKDSAYILGFYVSDYEAPYKTEIDAEFLNLKYKDSPDYRQGDLTFVLNYYQGFNYKYRIGIHNIFASSPETVTYQPPSRFASATTATVYKSDYSFVLFAGATYYEYLHFNANMDFYFSSYDNVKVYQITPKFGYSFGDYKSPEGSFYIEGKINFINLSNNTQTPEDKYTNFDVKLQNFKGPWVTTFKISLGKSAYKVDNDGFVVYNLGEEYKNSYEISLGKKFGEKDFISASVGYSVFEETEGYEASSATLLLSYSHTF